MNHRKKLIEEADPTLFLKCIDVTTEEGQLYHAMHPAALPISTKQDTSVYVLCPVCFAALVPGSGELSCLNCIYTCKLGEKNVS